MTDVLVLGGYGTFGSRICTRLANSGISLVVAGRSLERANEFAEKLRSEVPDATVKTAALDVLADIRAEIIDIAPTVVIDTCGPFQERDYTVAKACIASGVHYIDLADARGFVTGIDTLDHAARSAGVLVVSGASSVPALTSAVVEAYRSEFSNLNSVVSGISAAQRASGGLSTLRAIASYVGKRLLPCAGHEIRYGWQGLYRQCYPGLGKRWMSDCDVPDLELFPARYGLQSIRFSAGADNSPCHLGIWLFSWVIRYGLPIDLSKYGKLLSALYRSLKLVGTWNSAMHVCLKGHDDKGRSITRRWFIIARKGAGPNIPCVPAVFLAKRLVDGSMNYRGAVPCVGMIPLSDYLAALEGLPIEVVTEASEQ